MHTGLLCAMLSEQNGCTFLWLYWNQLDTLDLCFSPRWWIAAHLMKIDYYLNRLNYVHFVNKFCMKFIGHLKTVVWVFYGGISSGSILDVEW